MDEYKCTICFEDIYINSEKKLFFFDICKHKICGECLESHLNKYNRQHCPRCKVSITKKNVAPFDIEDRIYSNQKNIRSKLVEIFNKKRHNFENTPLYNNYLEKIEDIIYMLTHECDEKKRKTIEAYIKKYEKENIKSIEENNALIYENEKKKIHQIVKEEGNLYEIIKQRPIINKSNNEKYIHSLIKENPKLFDEVKVTNISESQPQPLNPAIKNDTDIPPRRFFSEEEIRKSDHAGGYDPAVVLKRSDTEFNSTVYLNVFDLSLHFARFTLYEPFFFCCSSSKLFHFVPSLSQDTGKPKCGHFTCVPTVWTFSIVKKATGENSPDNHNTNWRGAGRKGKRPSERVKGPSSRKHVDSRSGNLQDIFCVHRRNHCG
ncbi:CDK-activating kinase assembly factor, putative (MAT1) [Plasmodium ovale curtisi]|uniref:CDK-activating kinase assembly factor, putative (MAT1) n=1 Tax=Plasmodium ovale curtisi TaxID=864141 RepID=A0A1A8VXU7_PLAOA|nr:CDK-activating kinase assembly factor, putative (MAT1) [Plasmodium ovale curtisi]